jgi:hypothetical protein
MTDMHSSGHFSRIRGSGAKCVGEGRGEVLRFFLMRKTMGVEQVCGMDHCLEKYRCRCSYLRSKIEDRRLSIGYRIRGESEFGSPEMPRRIPLGK